MRRTALILILAAFSNCSTMTEQQRTDALAATERLILLAAEIGARYADPTDRGVGAQ
jgi:hypothetical protein